MGNVCCNSNSGRNRNRHNDLQILAPGREEVEEQLPPTKKRRDLEKRRTREKNPYLFSVGIEFLIFQRKDGAVCAIGDNNFGQLSLGDKIVRKKAAVIPFFAKMTGMEVIDVSTGFVHSMFLCKNGRLYGAGNNRYGQLSISKEVDDLGEVNPVRCQHTGPLNEKFVRVFAGGLSTYFLTDKGDVYSCGINFKGNLGIGARGLYIVTALKIETLEKVCDISCGNSCVGSSEDADLDVLSEYVLFLTESGRVFSTGCNRHGELALGKNKKRTYNRRPKFTDVPREVTYFRKNGISIDSMWASFGTSYFLTTDQRVYASGRIVGRQPDPKDPEFRTSRIAAYYRLVDMPMHLKWHEGTSRMCTGRYSNFTAFVRNDKFSQSRINGNFYFNLIDRGTIRIPLTTRRIEHSGRTWLWWDPRQRSVSKPFKGKKIEQIVNCHNGVWVICNGGREVYKRKDTVYMKRIFKRGRGAPNGRFLSKFPKKLWNRGFSLKNVFEGSDMTKMERLKWMAATKDILVYLVPLLEENSQQKKSQCIVM